MIKNVIIHKKRISLLSKFCNFEEPFFSVVVWAGSEFGPRAGGPMFVHPMKEKPAEWTTYLKPAANLELPPLTREKSRSA